MAENGTTGTIHIAAMVTPASPMSARATVLIDGVPRATVEGSSSFYSNPFLAGLRPTEPSPSITMDFVIEGPILKPSNVTLRYEIESVGVLNGYRFDNDWDTATGIEFDQVRVSGATTRPPRA